MCVMRTYAHLQATLKSFARVWFAHANGSDGGGGAADVVVDGDVVAYHLAPDLCSK